MTLSDQTETINESDEPEAPLEPAPPITNRFLFVDVASLRAKQLRRGSLPRVGNRPEAATVTETEIEDEAEGEGMPASEPHLETATAAPEHPSALPTKLERIAMEEVRRGLIHYDLPEPSGKDQEGT